MTRLRVKAETSSMFCGFVREERAYLADRIRFSIKGSWSRHSAQGPQELKRSPRKALLTGSLSFVSYITQGWHSSPQLTVGQALSHPSPIKKTPST